jgi:hypothetical protein
MNPTSTCSLATTRPTTLPPASNQPRTPVGAWGLLLILLSLLLAARAGYSQPGAWQSAIQSDGSGRCLVSHLVVDAAGNSYVTGLFTQHVQFGAVELVSQGRSDAFVAKLSAAGTWEWAVAVGGPGSDCAKGVAVDANGHVFVTGHFSEQVSFGATSLSSRGDLDIFVAQLDPNGQWLWAVPAGGPGMDQAHALTVSSTGELLIAGQFAERAVFGEQWLVSNGSSDIFVARLTRAGQWQWATGAGSAENDAAHALTTTATGDIYVTGFFSKQVAFGSSVLTGAGMDDAFVGKLSSAGKWQWATAATGSNTAYGRGIVADPAGGVFVTGSFSGDAAFGDKRLRSYSSDDGFVARLSDDGQWQWVNVLASHYLESVTGIALDRSGRLYVAGTFSQSIQGGSFRVTSQGYQDIFVGCLSRSGNWLALTAAGGPAIDEAHSLALPPGGGAYVAGRFSNTAAFGGIQLRAGAPEAQLCVGRVAMPNP